MDISAVTNLAQTIVQPAASVPPAQAAENRRLIESAKALNSSQFSGENRQLNFSVDPATRRLIFRIVDTTTNEVLEQVPAEYLLKMAEADRSAAAK